MGLPQDTPPGPLDQHPVQGRLDLRQLRRDPLAQALAVAQLLGVHPPHRTLRPLDTETIVRSVRKTSRVVSVEEGWPYAGIGAEICMLCVEQAFDWLDAPPARVAGLDVPLPYAANLEQLALPQPGWVVDAVRKLF